MSQRTIQQNKLYHEYCGRLHKQKEVTVWDGRFNVNPIRFPPSLFSYDEFRVWIAELDLEYRRDNEGKPVSSTKLTVGEMGSHIIFLEILLMEVDNANM